VQQRLEGVVPSRRRSAVTVVIRRTTCDENPRRAKKRLASRCCVGTLQPICSQPRESAYSITALIR